MAKVGEEAVRYNCVENDNHVKIYLCDGVVDELHFGDCIEREWVVFGINDVVEALKLVGLRVEGM